MHTTGWARHLPRQLLISADLLDLKMVDLLYRAGTSGAPTTEARDFFLQLKSIKTIDGLTSVAGRLGLTEPNPLTAETSDAPRML